MPLKRIRVGQNSLQSEFQDLENLVNTLRSELGPEGWHFVLSDEQLEDKFGRVYLNRTGSQVDFEAFLDLRVGAESPGGPTIEMASSKPGTYGIPGFTRILGQGKQAHITSTLDTFKDFLRASSATASGEDKPLQSVFWGVYQGTNPQYNERYNYPSGGSVVTPSSVSGKREFVAKTVRYMDQPQYSSETYGQGTKGYLEELLMRIGKGRIPGLEGYGPELNKWSTLTPITRYAWMQEKESATQEHTMWGETSRGVGSEYKSLTTTMEGRDIAATPMVYRNNRLLKLKPQPAPSDIKRLGTRQGFVRSSIILPGETEPRNVMVQNVMMADQPDFPGGALVSTSAFRVPTGKGQEPLEIYGFGEEQNLSSRLGFTTVEELLGFVSGRQKLDMYENRGRRIRSGRGRFEIGAMYGDIETNLGVVQDLTQQLQENPEKKRFSLSRDYSGIDLASMSPQEQRIAKRRWFQSLTPAERRRYNQQYIAQEEDGRTVFRKFQPITMERKGYDIRTNRPTLYIPRFYDPYGNDKGERAFSNVPREGYKTTDELAQALQAVVGEYATVQNYSRVGSGEEDSPAEVYFNMPIQGINPVSAKTGGFKAGLIQTGTPLQAEILGRKSPVSVDILTQEAKIPSRALMSAFGVMKPGTQLRFIEEFLSPQHLMGPLQAKDQQAYEDQMARMGATRTWLEQKYKNVPRGEQVSISMEEMADVYNASSVNGKPVTPMYSPDIMFAGILDRIMSRADDTASGDAAVRQGAQSDILRWWRRFGIGLPSTQMMATTTYSYTEARKMRSIVDETRKQLDAEAQLDPSKKRVSGEPVTFRHKSGGDFHMIDSQDILQRNQYQMRARTVAGQSLILPTGLTMVPEYQSQSGYIGPKAIMSMIDNYPEISNLMDLTTQYRVGDEIRTGFAGPLTGGPGEAKKGWMQLFSWLSFQRDLNESIPSIPKGSIRIDNELAGEIQGALDEARLGSTSKERLEIFEMMLRNIPKDRFGIPSTVDLANSFLFDPNTATLLPKLSSVMQVESYGEGTESEQTRTYISDQYFRLAQAAINAVNTEEGINWDVSSESRKRFYSRIFNEFQPAKSQGKGKEIYRNIYGVDLPGTRGGRYMALPQLESGESFADDDYIRKILTSGGMINPKDVESVLRYLNTTEDAYLPIMAQRFPDVSGQFVWMPMKLRSREYLRRRGVTLDDRKMLTEGTFFMTQTANRYFVGDFDADPAMQKLLPITDIAYDPKTDKERHTGVWHIASESAESEFQKSWEAYNLSENALNEALKGMFGQRGVKSGSDSLDASRKNMYDYMNEITNGNGSTEGRYRKVAAVDMMELMRKAMSVRDFKAGMGSAYNRRTLTEDIMDAVLTNTGGDPDAEMIREKAYESGAYLYQMYLDRQASVEGGFSDIESMINSIGIYMGKDATPADALPSYRLSGRRSTQGERQNLEENQAWTAPLWQQGAVGAGGDRGEIIRGLIRTLAESPDTAMMGDALLAWGFSQQGRQAEVYDALKKNTDPANRRFVLYDMMKTGAVGFRSPFYSSMAYKAVKRFREKEPAFFENQNVKIPWITGDILSAKEISETPEFKMTEILENLFVSGRGVLSAQDIQSLSNLGGTRLSNLTLGIWRGWMQSSGGLADTDPEIEDMQKRVRKSRQFIAEGLVKRKPLVHASELGALISEVPEGIAPFFTRPKKEYMHNAAYQVVSRYSGARELMGDRDYLGAQMFVPQNLRLSYEARIDEEINQESDIQLGNNYEAAFAKARAGGMYHIGKVKMPAGEFSGINPGNITFDVEGMTITGIPDFLSYNENTGALTITDTKLAQQNPATEPDVMRRVRSYKNRIQQMAYAYGLEELSRGTEQQWLDKMKLWGIDVNNASDRNKVLNMRTAAQQGKFEISLQPGNFKGGTLTNFNPIPIDWDDDARNELRGAAKYIMRSSLSTESIGFLAGELYKAIERPGSFPRGMSGYSRTGIQLNPRNYAQLANMAGYEPRMAGGGETSSSGVLRVGEGGPEEAQIRGSSGINSPRREKIRVGEAGPEDIIIDRQAGSIKIVPTSELPESKAMRNQDVGSAGKTDQRFAGGGDPFANLPASSLGGTTPSSHYSGLPTQDQVAQQAAAAAAAAQQQRLEQEGQRWSQLMDVLTNLGSGITVKMSTSNRSGPPDMTLLGRKVAAAEIGMSNLAPQMLKFESGVRGALTSALRAQGASGADAIAEQLGDAPLMELFQAAEGELGIEKILPRLAPYIPGAKTINKMLSGAKTLSDIFAGPMGQNIAEQINRQSPERLQKIQGLMQITKSDNEPTFSAVTSTGEVASMLQTLASYPELKGLTKKADLLELPTQSVERYVTAIGKLVDTTEVLTRDQMEHSKAIKDLVRTQGRLDEQNKAELELKRESAVIQSELARKAAGPIFYTTQAGEQAVMTPQQIASGLKASTVTPEQFSAYMDYGQAMKAVGQADEDLVTRKSGKGFGGVARNMLSGFGLMYLRSIWNIATGGTQFGYAEGLQEQMAYEQGMGGVLGGMPIAQNPQLRVQRMQAGYGGQGWRTLQNAYAGMMESSPALAAGSGMFTSALAGWGMSSYVLPQILAGAGIAGPAVSAIVPPVAIGVGLAAAGLTAYANTRGALDDVQGTTTTMAYRILNPQKEGWFGMQGRATAGERTAWNTSAEAGGLLALFDPKRSAYYRDDNINRETNILTMAIEATRRNPNTDLATELGKAGARRDEIPYFQMIAGRVRGRENDSIPLEGSIRASAFETANRLNMTSAQFTRMASQMAQGVPLEQTAANILQAGGLSTMQILGGTGQTAIGRMGQMLSAMGVTQNEAEQYQAGARYIAGLGAAGYWENNITGMPTDDELQAILGQNKQYSVIEGRKAGELFKQTRLAEYARRIAGQKVDQRPIQDFIESSVQTVWDAGRQQRVNVNYDRQFSDYQYALMMASSQQQQAIATMQSNNQQGLGTYFGVAPMVSIPATTRFGQGADLAFQANQISMGNQITQAFLRGGGKYSQATGIGQSLAGMQGEQASYYNALLNGDPMAIAWWLKKQSPNQQAMFANLAIPSQYGQAVPFNAMAMTDVNAQGQLTGLQWGTSSLATPLVSAQQMATNVWGPQNNWSGTYGQQGSAAIGAMLNGVQSPWGAQGQMLYGQQALRVWQLQKANEYNQAQVGTQLAQMQLTYAFTTGVGLGQYTGIKNPQTGQPFGFDAQGGGFWGIEDRQRRLNWGQQEWQLGFQQRQIALSDRQWQEQMGLQWQQNQTQRGWTRQDWAYQDRTRALQWSWRQEDFQEQARFMTGRERRLAERQMGRETVMHDIEGEQIDKTRQRQKEAWRMEDDRFNLQKRQHVEQLAMTKEELQKQREFFEERKKLEEEQVKLSRAYWTEQQRLAQAAAAASAEYARAQHEVQLAMLGLQTYVENVNGAIKTLKDVGMMEFLKVISMTDETIGRLLDKWGIFNEYLDQTATGPKRTDQRVGGESEGRQGGGRVMKGTGYNINELEPEFFIPDSSGTVVPLSKMSPWSDEVIPPAKESSTTRPTHVSIYIGGRHFRDVILDTVETEINI